MKFTQKLAILSIFTAATLFSCKESGNTTPIIPVPGNDSVPPKYALKMTIDATDKNIKADGKAIIDSNGGDEKTDSTGTIVANTEEGKTTAEGHELEVQQCGKRLFKNITLGLSGNEGFRTNIVLNAKDGGWLNSDTKRVAEAGIIFDLNVYKDADKKNIYDFFLLKFQPEITDGNFSGITCFFERYSGVKKYKSGIYSGHAKAESLGNKYIQDVDASNVLKTPGTWLSTLYTPVDKKTCKKALAKGSDYYLDDNGNAVIGVDVKQSPKGVYNVKIGKISYKVGEAAKAFDMKAFRQSWTTSFVENSVMGIGGETKTKTGDAGYIATYNNWTHAKKDDKDSNLKGAALAYGFAPQGTKPVVSYYTCSTKTKSNEEAKANTDFVGEWNVANDIEILDNAQDTVLYEDGNVIHEYVFF